jgi:peptidoglycan/xylan/chitin deacetylase (PgdA/CDA1 family)
VRKPLAGIVFVVCGAACGVDTHDSGSAVISAHTVVSLTFDDTLADQAQVADMAAARGMRVTFFINSPRLDTSGYLTRAQVIAFEQAGHEIGGHTLDHPNLTTLSTDDARTEICDDRDNLLAQGFRVTSFAYPFGADNTTVQQIVEQCGYNSARDVGGLKSAGACPGCPWTNPVPPTNLYEIRTNDSIHSDTSLATLEEYVTDAEQNGGGYVPIVFHHVCDGCNPDSITAANLATFLDWLQQRAPATQVGTVDQEIGGDVEPPTAGGTAANLVDNPSLEADADGNQVPDCWQRGGYGTSSATYTLTTDAEDGTRAQRIDVTSLSSGARRLVTAQDSGACAPPITVGHRYTMTAYYKSDVQPKFTVYYRNSSGQWVYFSESPSLPSSSSYRQATYTSPAMPSGATAISMGLGIFAVGSITMDNYTLVDADATSPADTAPPSVTIACNGNICSPNPYSSSVSVSLAGWDFSGIRSIRYTTNGSDPASSGITYTGAFNLSSTTTVRALATDNAGNTRALTKTISITSTDTTPPALSIACNGTACASTAYSSPVSVSLAASDASGIRSIRYTTDGSDPASGTLYAGPFTVSATATVRAIATDNAGNSATLSQTITIGSAPPANLLKNPSLETDANGDQVPDCWQRGGFGTNTATFTLTSDAFDGTRAQNINVTSFSSGARRLVSAQDSGACAPAVTPGRTYTMTAYYKSTAQPRFSVYYRDSSGSWVWFAESSALPATSTYTQATYTTPPMPSGATAISIGLSLFSTGSLTSDAYTLVQN